MKRKSKVAIDFALQKILQGHPSTPGFEQTRDLFILASMTYEEQREYYMYIDNIEDVEIMRRLVDYAYETAKSEGFEKGFKEGIEKGQSKLIRTMHSNGMDISAISSMTGIDQATIESILAD